MTDFDQAEIAAHLERLLASDVLNKSATIRRLLSYLVQRHVQGADGPKEAQIAIDVFGRDASFHGGDDSVVRVAMRGLRQKLLEYYAGQGKDDRFVFEIPKGSYRLKAARRDEGGQVAGRAVAVEVLGSELAAEAPSPTGVEPRPWSAMWLKAVAAALALLLLASVAANAYLWSARVGTDPAIAQVRRSALWQDIVASDRPVMIVLGDIFMYTQADPVTGRLQTVRDPQIDSSEDLRAFLASNPALASVRGQRYASYIQKSAAVGMATVIPIVSRPGRRVEVRLRDELRAEDLGRYDIIYVGPFSRLGPLDAVVHETSRYRFDAATSGVTDVASGKVYLPEGALADHRKDYALVSSFRGASGSRILIITAGGRNAGLGQVVRTVTSPEGLSALDLQLRASGASASGAFEALVCVAGYRQTDLSAQFVGARRL